MNEKPIITFRVAQPSTASPEAIYSVLSNLQTHLVWAGEQAPKENFRLLSLDAPAGAIAKGGRWTSTGANSRDGSMTFHDESVVVTADSGRRFGWDTEARLERARARTWLSHFEHRYVIEPTSGGSLVTYTCDVYPKNYRPYWLHPMMRPMTKMMVNRMHAKHMVNLARMAENEHAEA